MTENELRFFLDSYKQQIRREAQQLIPLPLPEPTEDLFSLYERTGNRLWYENVYFERRRFLVILGLQALIEKKQRKAVSRRLMKKLTNVIRDTCRETCWALPAHVNRETPGWEHTVDLFAAETCQTLSELADRLRGDLPPDVYGLIAENAGRRVLLPFVSSESDFGWEKAGHNWNAVCAGAIGSACLHIMREKKAILKKCVQRVCRSLPYYIDGFSEDGACMEGLGYYTYGMAYFVNFAQELYAYTHGKTDLLRGTRADGRPDGWDKRPAIAAFFGKCYFPDGRTVNFSDASDHEKFCMGLACALKRRFPRIRIPSPAQAAGPLEEPCFRFVFRKMDLEETENYLALMKSGAAPEEPFEPKCHKLLNAQWCIASAGGKAGFACKGGHNGEPHNHNDVGHFIYESAGTALLADLGAGEYTADYFGTGRYAILCNNSFGHSVPIIAGRGQQPGKEYGCREFAVDERLDHCVVQAEFSGAYEKGLVERLQRQFCFSMKDGSLRVRDTFALPEGREALTVEENLISQIQPVLRENDILLPGGAVTAVLCIEGIRPDRDVRILPFVHMNHSGEAEQVYALRWQVNLPARTGSSAFTVRIREPEPKE